MKKKVHFLAGMKGCLKAIPNFLTICNSLCGFAAIINLLYAFKINDYTAPGVFAFSAFLIFFAMVFDAFDGFAARLLNAASMHGIQMDSLADMVTFGAAPATLIVVMTDWLTPASYKASYFYLTWLMSAIYLGCAALRLATYNVHAILEKKSGDKFSGLPSPGAAAAICTFAMLYNWISRRTAIPEESLHLEIVLPVYGMILGFLMVSNIPYAHFAKWLLSIKRNKKRLLIVLAILLAAAYQLEITAFLVVNCYILYGILAAAVQKITLFKRKG